VIRGEGREAEEGRRIDGEVTVDVGIGWPDRRG